MDYLYNFKQGHIDRLEDAGIKQYRPADGYGVSRPRRRESVTRVGQRLKAIAITALQGITTTSRTLVKRVALFVPSH